MREIYFLDQLRQLAIMQIFEVMSTDLTSTESFRNLQVNHRNKI